MPGTTCKAFSGEMLLFRRNVVRNMLLRRRGVPLVRRLFSSLAAFHDENETRRLVMLLSMLRCGGVHAMTDARRASFMADAPQPIRWAVGGLSIFCLPKQLMRRNGLQFGKFRKNLRVRGFEINETFL